VIQSTMRPLGHILISVQEEDMVDPIDTLGQAQSRSVSSL
jgi:hypothetical protein